MFSYVCLYDDNFRTAELRVIELNQPGVLAIGNQYEEIILQTILYIMEPSEITALIISGLSRLRCKKCGFDSRCGALVRIILLLA